MRHKVSHGDLLRNILSPGHLEVKRNIFRSRKEVDLSRDLLRRFNLLVIGNYDSKPDDLSAYHKIRSMLVKRIEESMNDNEVSLDDWKVVCSENPMAEHAEES